MNSKKRNSPDDDRKDQQEQGGEQKLVKKNGDGGTTSIPQQKTQVSDEKPALPDGWKELEMEDGQIVYINDSLGRFSKTHPSLLGGDDETKRTRRIPLGGLTISQRSELLRENYAESSPKIFDIGAMSSLQEPILQKDLFISFSQNLSLLGGNGGRRGFASIVGMPGWGKTYAMSLLAKLMAVCKGENRCCSVMHDNDDTDTDADITTALRSHIGAWRNLDRDILSHCVPLAVTLNSTMCLPEKESDENKITFYNREIAKRLAYSYLADVKRAGYHKWDGNVQIERGGVWNCGDVLTGLKQLAIQAGIENPILVLLIDEPDHMLGASSVLATLASSALNMDFGVECRVIMSALERDWLFVEQTKSGRLVTHLKLDPPDDTAVTTKLIHGLSKKFTEVHASDIEEVAEYVVAMAAGHWRTISTIHDALKECSQVVSGKSLKLFVGEVPPHIQIAWINDPNLALKQLEESLAHAVIGSKLQLMEPINEGTAWQAVVNGVILQYLDLKRDGSGTIDAIVPLHAILRLAEMYMYKTTFDHFDFERLRKIWYQHDHSKSRNDLLVNVLSSARFFPSSAISSRQKNHESFENLTAHFMLLRWDAHARIDEAAKKRWAVAATNLMVKPRSDAQSKLGIYDVKQVEKLRNETNAAWLKSLDLATTNPASPPAARPNLWLVPPPETRIKDEADRRLCIFRGAECCTESNQYIKVVPPAQGKPMRYICRQKLTNKKATVDNQEGALAAGSVIEPAKGNDGFDSLTVLSKVGGGSAFTLIENKFETSNVGATTAWTKLRTLKQYRGVLWEFNDKAPDEDDLLERLGLPLVTESDIVWVLLADDNYTGDLRDQIREELQSLDAFQGHVLLTTSRKFFGPCFGRLGILDENTKKKSKDSNEE